MDLGALEVFARGMRQELMRLVRGKIAYALMPDSRPQLESPNAVRALREALSREGEDGVTERIAYTWFNRFCALRFMDVNGYTPAGVVTPAADSTRPGILAEAQNGNFDVSLFATDVPKRVTEILNGSRHESDPFASAYRILFIAACNSWHDTMPFLFEKLGDWTELLLPDDLLTDQSVLAKVRTALTPDVCEGVEVIGWLYQFYIGERKDAIEEGFKKNLKATPDKIAAVTQLFTPLWIVKYLVQNSLGRLWLTLHPESSIREKMEFYVPDEGTPIPVPNDIQRPEDIRLCDLCCGSGHILVYAFDLLYLIYEEQGYSPAEIPRLILTHNLYGLEQDPRAAALAAFALMMKARARSPRFFRNPVQPNICALEKVEFTQNELEEYRTAFGASDLFTPALIETLHQFKEADNFGSLIVPATQKAAALRPIFEAKTFEGELLLHTIHQKVLKVLRQAEFLSPRYHVMVTNPPYLGGKNMNPRLKTFAEEKFKKSKSDLFAMFIERAAGMCQASGLVAMITMQSWMFLSSYEDLRKWMLENKTILSMAHLGARAFDTIGGEVVSTTAFVLLNQFIKGFKGAFVRLVDGQSEAEKAQMFKDAVEGIQQN